MTTALLRASRWRRWMALEPEERSLLLRSLWLLVKAHFTLASTQFEPAPAVAETADVPDAALVQAQRRRAHHVARLVAYAAAICPVKVACLHRSVVLWQLLGREGIPRSLKIGVRADTQQVFGAHAWVECHNEPLHEAADLYQQFSAFGAAVVPVRASAVTAQRHRA